MTEDILSEPVLDAIDSISPSDWHEFFELCRQQTYVLIRSAPESELTAIQGRVKLLDEMEQLFVSARQSKPSSK